MLAKLADTVLGMLLATGMAPGEAKRRLSQCEYTMQDMILMAGDGRGRFPLLEWDLWDDAGHPPQGALVPLNGPKPLPPPPPAAGR